MREWFAGLTQREQVAVLALSLVLALWLLYQLALAPVLEQRRLLRDSNASAAALLGRVDLKVAELTNLRNSGGSVAVNLTASINQSTQAVGLAVSRMQPNSRGEVQVRFEDVDYDRLVQWIHRAELTDGLVIVDASIGQAGRSGGVNATVRVAEG